MPYVHNTQTYTHMQTLYIHIHNAFIHIYTCMSMHIQIYTHTLACLCIYKYTQIYTHTHAHTYSCMHTLAQTIYPHLCTHTYINTHTLCFQAAKGILGVAEEEEGADFRGGHEAACAFCSGSCLSLGSDRLLLPCSESQAQLAPSLGHCSCCST